jgi:hypothetical protein
MVGDGFNLSARRLGFLSYGWVFIFFYPSVMVMVLKTSSQDDGW